MKNKTKKYSISFVYDNEIVVNKDYCDYWWDEIKDILVVVSSTTSFYEKSRISNLKITERSDI